MTEANSETTHDNSSRRLKVLLAILLPLAAGLIGYHFYPSETKPGLTFEGRPVSRDEWITLTRRSRHEQYLPGLDTNDLARNNNFDRLLAFRPDESRWRDGFDDLVANRRKENIWLNHYFDRRGLAPPEGPLGERPGPTTMQHFLEAQSLWDAVRDDYRRHNTDSQDLENHILELFDRNFSHWYLGNPGNLADRCTVIGMLNAGDCDPLIAIFASMSMDLDKKTFKVIDKQLDEMIRRRPMSVPTLMLLCQQMSKHPTKISAANRATLSMQWEDRIEEILAERFRFAEAQPYFDFLIFQALKNGNGPVQSDWLHRVIDLYEQPETTELVPPKFLNRLIGECCWQGAQVIRGGMFVSQAEPIRLRLQRTFGLWARDHLMLAHLEQPDDPFIVLHLMSIELSLGVTPLNMRQWYRIARTIRCDSKGNSSMMAHEMQPRWGGSMRQLRQFVEQSIESSAADTDHRLIFSSSLRPYLTERGKDHHWTREDSIGKPLGKLAKSSLQLGEKDPRFDVDEISLVTRALWDAADLRTLDRWLEMYCDDLSDEWIFHYRTPTWLLHKTMAAFRHEDAPRESIQQLHQELMVGVGLFDDQRTRRVERSLQEAESFAQSLEDDDPCHEAITDIVNFYRGILDGQTAYERNEMVEIFDLNIPKTYQYALVNETDESFEVAVECRNADFMMWTPCRFYPPYEAILEIETIEDADDPRGLALSTGPVTIAALGSPSEQSLRYVPSTRKASINSLPMFGFADEVYDEILIKSQSAAHSEAEAETEADDEPEANIEPDTETEPENETEPETNVPPEIDSQPVTATLRMVVTDEGVEGYVNDQWVGHQPGRYGQSGVIQIFRGTCKKFPEFKRSTATAKYNLKRFAIRRLDETPKQPPASNEEEILATTTSTTAPQLQDARLQ